MYIILVSLFFFLFLSLNVTQIRYQSARIQSARIQSARIQSARIQSSDLENLTVISQQLYHLIETHYKKNHEKLWTIAFYSNIRYKIESQRYFI